MAYQINPRKAIINATAIGNVTVVPANQLGNSSTGTSMGSIRVWQVLLSGAGANIVTFYAGATSLGEPIQFTGAGGSVVLQNEGVPWFECPPGQPLVINTSTTAAVTGSVWYTLA